MEENKRCDSENAELKARIEELEKNNTKENAELRDRLGVNVTKVTNSPNDSSSNFNSVAEQ